MVQHCFVVLSDIDMPVPLVHAICLSEFRAEEEISKASTLPEDFRRNIRTVPAVLTFDHRVKE